MPAPRSLPLLAAMALSACAHAPPPIVLQRPPPARHAPAPRKEAARVSRCEQPARAPIGEAEKVRLFDDFDRWQGERRPPGTAAVPPPAPGPGTTGAVAAKGCRVVRD